MKGDAKPHEVADNMDQLVASVSEFLPKK